MVKTKKNNYRKRRQTRCKKSNHYKKQKGGSPSGYTIVGFNGVINNSREGAMMPDSGNGNVKNVPICLPDHEIPGSLSARIGSGSSIILPELYKVEWVHGKLDFIKSIKYHINFFDRNENLVFPILPWQEHPPNQDAPPEKLEKWFNEKISPGSAETRRDIIQDIEATYPGLFIPILPADDSRYHYAYDKTYTQSV
jgi:hypothetical protein